MAADGMPSAAAQRIMVGFKAGEEVLTPSKGTESVFLHRALDTLDWVCSLPSEDRRIRRIERMSWSDAEEHSRAWHASLDKARTVSGNLMADVRKIADFDGGAFMVELESQKALSAEGAAMGHCVGGYWSRVATGQTRIVSLRDDKGQPHVTIELGRPPRVDVVGRGEVSVARVPPNGVSSLLETREDWRAVQVRGKGNQVPVDRWLKLVTEWLAMTGIGWSEASTNYSVDEVGPVVYTVSGTAYLDPLAATAAGETVVLADIAKRRSFSSYASSGLQAIHAALGDDNGHMVDGFLSRALPACTEILWGRMKVGSSMVVAIRESGVGRIMSIMAERDSGRDSRLQILNRLLEFGPQEARSSRLNLVEEPGGPGIDLVVHEIPLAALALLSSGLASGAEDLALDRLRPHLAEAIAEAGRSPEALHAITSIEGATIAEDDIHRGILASGLGVLHSEATAAVGAGVRTRRREVLLRLKQVRSSGRFDVEQVNGAANALSEGFEERLVRLVQNALRSRPFLIRPVPAAQPVARTAALPEAALKRYAVPPRAPVRPSAGPRL